MRKYAFIIAILGIFVLLLFLNYQAPIPVSAPENLKNLTENQKVLTRGTVIEEKFQKSNKILVLDNNLEILCDIKSPYYVNKNITILGVYDNFQKPRIKAMEIKDDT